MSNEPKLVYRPNTELTPTTPLLGESVQDMMKIAMDERKCAMRETCLFCALKHLSQALILIQESRQGYPLHRWLAVGHMAEAADELLEDYPEFANHIRKMRVSYIDDENFDPPIMDAIGKLDAMVKEQFPNGTTNQNRSDDSGLAT